MNKGLRRMQHDLPAPDLLQLSLTRKLKLIEKIHWNP